MLYIITSTRKDGQKTTTTTNDAHTASQQANTARELGHTNITITHKKEGTP